MTPERFDDWIAQRYEQLWPELFDPATIDPAVDFLADLAHGGSALELGIGTGRIALPLSRRGVAVHGIDRSAHMIAALRGQPGADAIGVTVGDFATATVGRRFPLAYLLRNTITNLTTQDRTPTHIAFEEYDLAAQIAVSHHYWMIDGELRTFTSPHRYLWPAELDLMARIAGMTLRERWSDWHRTPFTGDSRHHISVWGPRRAGRHVGWGIKRHSVALQVP